MSVISMKQLLEAGVHFGHQTRRWNPKMAPYIYTERNGIYIIDLQKSVGKVDEAYKAISDIAADGGTILFVGTKKQAQDAIQTEAERCGMFYVNERWLGGMLTNFKTIQGRIARLKAIETMQEDGTFDVLPKKEVIALKKELEKLQKNLGGIKDMKKIPDAIFLSDVQSVHLLRVTVSLKLRSFFNPPFLVFFFRKASSLRKTFFGTLPEIPFACFLRIPLYYNKENPQMQGFSFSFHIFFTFFYFNPYIPASAKYPDENQFFPHLLQAHWKSPKIP